MGVKLPFDILHALGRAEAKRRIEAGLPKFERHIPGGSQIQASWTGEDRLTMAIAAMGQQVGVDFLVEDRAVKGSVSLPLMLAIMSGTISDSVRTSLEKVLAKARAEEGEQGLSLCGCRKPCSNVCFGAAEAHGCMAGMGAKRSSLARLALYTSGLETGEEPKLFNG
jgi:hypothetical protein